MKRKRLFIIVVVRNQFNYTIKCLNSIYRNTDMDYKLCIVDNASDDETIGLYNISLPNTILIRNNENLYWAGGVNQGLKLADGDFIVLMNNDIEVGKHWSSNLASVLMTDPKIGAVGPMCSSPRDWQYYYNIKNNFKINLPEIDDLSDLDKVNNILSETNKGRFLYIRGMLAFFCVMFPSNVVNEVGLLDEEFIMGGDDDDYCRRLENKGYMLALSLQTYVIHEAGKSLNTLTSEEKERFRLNNLYRLHQKYPDYYRIPKSG